MAITKNPYLEYWTEHDWQAREIIEFCDCHEHAVSLGILWDGEEEDEWAYMDVFYSIHPWEWSWRQRLLYIWRILTGNVAAMWEVVLNKQKAVRFAKFILACAGEDREGPEASQER